MIIEPIIFFDMIASILILSAVLAGVIFYFSRRIKKLHNAIPTNIMDDAREKALRIIDDANGKALDIITKTNMSADIASENLNEQTMHAALLQIKQLEKATAEFSKLYSQTLQDLRSKNIEILQNVSQAIETNASEEIKSFRKSVEQLTVSSETLVKKKIDSDYEIVKKEIGSYKESELKKINDGIYTLLEKISRIVIGKALNLSDHEDLIMKSLEKAKKEGAFET